jgi:hypothetical protein
MQSPRDSHSRSCACGCGGHPRGGEFLPGHDARLRGKYLCRIDDGDEKAISEFLEERPRLARSYGYTEARLRARMGQGCEPRRRQKLFIDEIR